MAIIATNESNFVSDPAPSGNHVARCIRMIHLGTIEETSPLYGTSSKNKIQVTWELPNETKVWKDGEGEKPYVVSKEYNLTLGKDSNLRKDLESWRGRPFTEDQVKAFDVSNLIGVPCMLNVVHAASKKDPSKVYANVSSIAPLPKGLVCPDAMNELKELSYDNFDWDFFNSLPDFIKGKITSSLEYTKLTAEEEEVSTPPVQQSKPVAQVEVEDEEEDENEDSLPF